MRNPKTTSYTFRRIEAGVILLRNVAGASTLVGPEASMKVANHASEFNFGYGGSGPAQLALAILLDFTGDKGAADDGHQAFKFQFVAHVEDDEATITGAQIAEFLQRAAVH